MDILIPFVDNADFRWQEAMLQARGLRYLSREARTHFLNAMNNRFASYGLFKYWFRSVENNYSDMNKIHLLLMQPSQVPSFLAQDERVVIHYHDEFIPEKFRPCFNSSVIELCAMKELELSPLYILANDDMYVNEPVDDSMLSVNKKPKAYIHVLPKYGNSLFQTFLENGRRMVSDYFGKECPCYDWGHLWQIYDDKFCKKLLTDNWDAILKTMTPFREQCNVNHMLCMMAQNLEDISIHDPEFPHNGYYSSNNVPKSRDLIGKKIICINDSGSSIQETRTLLEHKFTYPSSFERFSSVTHGLPENVLNKYITYGEVAEIDYSGDRIGELFVHWYYVSRKKDCITKCEAFHMNMFRLFAIPKRVSKIHLRVAGTNNPDCVAIRCFKTMLDEANCELDLAFVENDTERWEHDTFKECIEYAIQTKKYVYYIHFKGVTHFHDADMSIAPRPDKHGDKMNEIDIMYWCYLMYRGLFDPKGARYAARGPLYRNGILREYKTLDKSWSYTNTANHYMGSFQAYDGIALANRFEKMNMDASVRLQKLWIGNRYTVEQFLSLVFNPSEVYSILLGSLMSYSMHSDMRFGPYLREFDNMHYDDIIVNPVHSKSYAVLTYIFGNNEVLRPVTTEEDVDYVCVTDDETLSADGWTVIVDKLEWLKDPRSKYHYVKLHPFDYVTADRVMIVDGSYQLSSGINGFMDKCTSEVSLKPHPKRNTIGEELPEWIKSRGLSIQSAQLFNNVTKMLGGDADCTLYEFDISVWGNTDTSHEMLEWAWKILISCADQYDTFLSNQLAISLLAGTMYKGKVSAITEQIPWMKYKHNVK